MDTAYRTWRFLQDRVIGHAAAAMLLGATLLACVEIFRRYVEGRTFHWGQDAVTYFLCSAAFLYFGASQAARAHLAVTLLPDFLIQSGRKTWAHVVRATASLFGVVFIAAFVWWGLPSAERSYELGRLTESMIIPLWPFQYILLIGMAMMGITMAFQFYREVMRILGHEVFPWDADNEDPKL